MKTHTLGTILTLLALTSCGSRVTSGNEQQSSIPNTQTSSLPAGTSSSVGKTFEVKTSDGILQTEEGKEYKFCKAREEDKDLEPQGRIPFEFAKSLITSIDMNSIKFTTSSSSFPSSALSVGEFQNQGTSNILTGGTILIDLTKVELGTYMFSLELTSGTSFRDKGKITLSVTFVEFGSITYETIDEVVKIDYSRIPQASRTNLYAQFMVDDLPYGCLTYDEEGHNFKGYDVSATEDSFTFNLKVRKGDRLSFTFSQKLDDGHFSHPFVFDNSDSKNSSYVMEIKTDTAFITFLEADQSINLKVKPKN